MGCIPVVVSDYVMQVWFTLHLSCVLARKHCVVVTGCILVVVSLRSCGCMWTLAMMAGLVHSANATCST